MDSEVKDVNGNKPYSVEESREEVVNGGGESKSLLHNEKKAVANGGMQKKRQRSSRRRVQWNDRNGSKLVEVLEFQPSDSSDSEDEYGDSCICTIM